MNHPTKIGLIFPHQLFENNELLFHCNEVYLIEEFLFFKLYTFHKMKLAYHRASMKFYEQFLINKGIKVNYINSIDEISNIRKLISYIEKRGIQQLVYIDPTDNWLEKRIQKSANEIGISLLKLNSPLFINSSIENKQFFSNKKRFFQTDFYIYQRKKLQILVEEKDKPLLGKWSFDAENRLKYPKGKIAPKVIFPEENELAKEASNYIEKHYPNNPGKINLKAFYPYDFDESKKWLNQFFENRFKEFGEYEDALVSKENFLHHSVLSPMMNVGLMSPQYVIQEALNYADTHEISMNSLEGFIRQIIGWREFIRAVYELKGTEERTRNYWNFSRSIPASFWTGTTGIKPIDETIKKVLETGYCHHIERLMVLGNFMLLCEFNPDEVYKWFMEMFIDAYDWVMVTNVYGMSQFADGGLMATKPYISGSNYLMKMSNYEKGEWQKTWDALFWRFMHTQRDFFLKNPRLGMLVKTFDKMSDEKRNEHLKTAEIYLNSLS
jgi:deoxyribodipyrimidine photolyase-related protein